MMTDSELEGVTRRHLDFRLDVGLQTHHKRRGIPWKGVQNA
jgi:hypothetical protein